MPGDRCRAATCEGLIGAGMERRSPRTALELHAVPTAPGDVIFFDSFVPHASKENRSAEPRRILYLTWNLADDGDRREQYYADKRAAFPPDVERRGDVAYVFRV